MKRIISFAAALTLVFGAASCQKDNLAGKEGDSTVTFTFELPEETATKAQMADGSTVDVLYYEAYVDDGPAMYDGKVNKNADGKFSVELKLVSGQTYQLLFWAQKDGTGFYNTYDLRNIHVNYDGLSNDETRDAFYGSRLDFEPSGIATQETVYLYRPFAQVNFATSKEDWKGAETFVTDYSAANRLKSRVEFNQLPNRFNVMTRDIVPNSYAYRVEFDYNLAPISEDKYTNNWISYDGNDYAWVAMNYILASKDEMAVDATARFIHKKNDVNSALVKEVPSVPVKQNYRTNILGEFFTGGNKFDIVIVPGFVDSMNNNDTSDDENNPDYILTIPIRKAFELGGEVSLDNNLTISSPFELKSGKEVKVNLNGKSITCENGSDAFVVTNGTLTIEGAGTVTTQDKTAGYAIIVDGPDAVVYVKGGDYVIGVDDVAQYGEYACNSAVYAKNGGKAYVSGGLFKVDTEQTIAFPYSTRFLLNLKDKTADGSQDNNLIEVTGGSFVNFNPAANIAEGDPTNFVADGYKVTETTDGEDKIYTVTAE